MPDHDTFVRDWMQKYPDATIDDAEDQFAQELINSLDPLPSTDYVIDRMTHEEKDTLLRGALAAMSEIGRTMPSATVAGQLEVVAATLTEAAPKWMVPVTGRDDDDVRWWCDLGGHEFPEEVVEVDPSLIVEGAWEPEDEEDEGNVDPGACSREKWCGAVRHDADCPIAFL